MPTRVYAFALLALALPLARSFAYPSFIGLGYGSCSVCHYNPLGNGPLTDYGRALAAIEISGHALGKGSDEDLGNQSGFLGGVAELPSWLRLSAGYRGLLAARGLESDPAMRWIHMQAEASVTVPFSRVFMASATAGYLPPPPGQQPSTTPTAITREHYVAVKPLKSLGFYLGFMDQAFGIRVPDHSAYLRYQELLGINDQTHGLMIHFGVPSFEIAAHLVAGNLLQKPEVRQRGGSIWFETATSEDTRLGASVLMTSSQFRSRTMGAIHARARFGKASSVLAELGFTRETIPSLNNTRLGDFAFVQATGSIGPGLAVLFTLEHYAADLMTAGARILRAGPGLVFFPLQRLELRVDFRSTRVTGGQFLDPNEYSLISQAHVSL